MRLQPGQGRLPEYHVYRFNDNKDRDTLSFWGRLFLGWVPFDFDFGVSVFGMSFLFLPRLNSPLHARRHWTMSFSIYCGTLHALFPKFQIVFHFLTGPKKCLLARWADVSFDGN